MAEAEARPAIEEVLTGLEEDFALLEEWEDRYRHLMELGRALPPLTPAEMVEANRVAGCQSRVWLVARMEGGRLRLRAGSDAAFVQGLLALFLQVFDDRTPQEIAAVGTDFLARLGLGEALSMSRRNGAAAVLARIRAAAGV